MNPSFTGNSDSAHVSSTRKIEGFLLSVNKEGLRFSPCSFQLSSSRIGSKKGKAPKNEISFIKKNEYDHI